MERELKPGELSFGPECIHGYRPFERVREDGTRETGVAKSVRDGLSPGAIGIVELEGRPSDSGPCVLRVKSETRFTMHGPPSVASNAYRSGWDAVFSRSTVKAS